MKCTVFLFPLVEIYMLVYFSMDQHSGHNTFINATSPPPPKSVSTYFCPWNSTFCLTLERASEFLQNLVAKR